MPLARSMRVRESVVLGKFLLILVSFLQEVIIIKINTERQIDFIIVRFRFDCEFTKSYI
jgi:hypothetical protein